MRVPLIAWCEGQNPHLIAQGSCFAEVPYPDSDFSYNAAVGACGSAGGFLAAPYTAAAYNGVKDVFTVSQCLQVFAGTLCIK